MPGTTESFGRDYQEARAKFLAAAGAAGARIDSVTHPHLGPDGEELICDVAWIGPTRAEKVLVLISGTHGVEGFCGSGAQVDWLRREEPSRLPTGVSVMLVHAVNPWGFAWLRRGNEDNIDLNRNWIDFHAPLPHNPAYAELADAIVPPDRHEDTRRACDAVIDAYIENHGWAAFYSIVARGQYDRPTGLCYGGVGPSWSRRTQTALFAHYLAQAGAVGIIDYHTGRGPWGFSEQILPLARGGDHHRRAARWYGAALCSTVEDNETTARIRGDALGRSPELLPHAEVTPVYIEVGTQSQPDVIAALRADAWLHAHGDIDSPSGRAIKSQIRNAYYVDSDDWRGMVAGVSLVMCRQAVAGLARSG